MPATKEQILDMAKLLPDAERWELLTQLEATFDPPVPDGMTREEFSAELERRWQDHLADPSKSRPVDEVLAEMRKLLHRD